MVIIHMQETQKATTELLKIRSYLDLIRILIIPITENVQRPDR